LKRSLAFAIAALTLSTSGHAQYVFDPADLPEDFKCDKDLSAKECEEERVFEAYWSKYSEQYDQWHNELQFTPSLFFRDSWHDNTGKTTPNLVDAVYTIALRRYGDGWAFAVQADCPENDIESVDRFGKCRPVLRMLQPKPKGTKYPDWLKSSMPTKRETVAAELAEMFDWLEADLRHCKPALNQLIAFPNAVEKIWPDAYLEWMMGQQPDPAGPITVTTDGYGVVVRASGRSDPSEPDLYNSDVDYFADQSNGGESYDWAIKMHKLVQPCLKPSTAVPPWQVALKANAAVATE
jgi:hypothetical protein